MERKIEQPPVNEGEGNKTAAREYNQAAKRHADTKDTEGIARDAAQDLSELMKQLRHFDVGMLVTEREDGRIAARPMYMADLANDGTIHLVTSREAHVVEEITKDASVAITFQKGNRYLSMTASCEIRDEPEILRKFWKESFRVWFPEGPASERAVVLELHPQEAEYWDESGVQGIRYMLKAVASYLKGESMQGKKVGKHGTTEIVAPRPR